MYDLSGRPPLLPPPPCYNHLIIATIFFQPKCKDHRVTFFFILETLLIGPPCYSTRILLPSVGKFIGFCCITMKTIKC